MTTGSAPICLGCRYLHEDDEEGFTCEAFPAGIPEAIIYGAADHHLPFEGDQGIQYAPKEDAGAGS